MFRFIIPRNAEGEAPYGGVPSDFLAAFGINAEPPASADPPSKDPDPAPAPTDPPASTDPPPTPPDPDPGQTGQKPPEPSPQPPDKAAQAFAQMRIENNKFKNTLKDIAGILGVQAPDDTQALLAALNDKIVAAQAQKQGIPAELLQRMNNLVAENETAKAERIQAAAYIGFQKVKDTFKITDAELGTFADELRNDNVNPFMTEMDLVSEYKLRHFEDIVRKASDEAVRAEQARAAQAAASGTKPDQTTGQNGGNPAGKIDTVSALTNYFNSNFK